MQHAHGKIRTVLWTFASALLVAGIGCERKPDAVAAPIKVGAIFSVTGPAAFLGLPEKQTAEMLVERINAEGGINGARIELIVMDSKGENEAALSAAKQLVEEQGVVAIIGPSRSNTSMAIKGYCEENKTPLISCAAAEEIVFDIKTGVVPRYVFKTPQKDSYAAIMIFQTMNDLGISRIGVVYGGTGFGQGGAAQLARYAPEYGIEILISESYDPKAPDLAAVLTKVKEKDVEAVVNWSIVPAQALIARNMKQLELNVPLFQSHGFGNIKYVQTAGEAAEGTIFPCGRLLIADVLPDDHPQKQLLVEYKKAYEERFKEDVSTFGGHAYDALMILVKALRQVGPDREKIRDAIETMRFVGTAGTFQFTPEDHNGLGLDSFEMLTVKNGKFAPYVR